MLFHALSLRCCVLILTGFLASFLLLPGSATAGEFSWFYTRPDGVKTLDPRVPISSGLALLPSAVVRESNHAGFPITRSSTGLEMNPEAVDTIQTLFFGELDPTRGVSRLEFSALLEAVFPNDLQTEARGEWMFVWGPDVTPAGMNPNNPPATGLAVIVSLNRTDGELAGSLEFLLNGQPATDVGGAVLNRSLTPAELTAALAPGDPQSTPGGNLSLFLGLAESGGAKCYLDLFRENGLVLRPIRYNTPLPWALPAPAGWKAALVMRSTSGGVRLRMLQSAGSTTVEGRFPSLPLTLPGDRRLPTLYGGMTFRQDAAVSVQQGISAVQVVPDLPLRNGSVVFNPGLRDMLPAEVSGRLLLSAAGAPGDGFALSILPNGHAAFLPAGEEGTTMGLVYSVDLYQNPGEPAPGLTIRWNGAEIAYKSVDPAQLIQDGIWQDFSASCDPTQPWLNLTGASLSAPDTTGGADLRAWRSQADLVLSARTGNNSCGVWFSNVAVRASRYIQPAIIRAADTYELIGLGQLSAGPSLSFSAMPWWAGQTLYLDPVELAAEAGTIPRAQFWRTICLGRPPLP